MSAKDVKANRYVLVLPDELQPNEAECRGLWFNGRLAHPAGCAIQPEKSKLAVVSRLEVTEPDNDSTNLLQISALMSS
jgi:hypothetical protein